MSRRLKIWLALEFIIAFAFYYGVAAFVGLLPYLWKMGPIVDFGPRFATFCATYVFFFATFKFVNCILSIKHRQMNAYTIYIEPGWFSVHRYFMRRKECV